MQVHTAYNFCLLSYCLARAAEHPHGCKGFVVVLFTYKQVEQHGDSTQLYLQLQGHWVGLLMLHWKWQYIQVFG